MKTENLSTLKIHKLSQAQYDRELASGNIDESALYLTPDENIDLTQYATIEHVDAVANTKANISHEHSDLSSAISNLNTLVGDTSVSEQINDAIKDKLDNTHKHDEYINQNAFSNIAIESTTITADSVTDTLTLVAGDNIVLTPDADGDKITISATDAKYTHPTSGVTEGTYKSVTVDAEGHVINGYNPTTLNEYGITDAATTTDVNDLKELIGNESVPDQIESAIDALTRDNFNIYVQDNEPHDAPDGSVWFDTDEVSSEESNVIIDTTLTQSGQAADAKVVGDFFSEAVAVLEDFYEELNKKVDEAQLTVAVNDAIAKAKESGELNGEAGYTPVRGTDYWTDADKAEIKSYVDEAILGGAW